MGTNIKILTEQKINKKWEFAKEIKIKQNYDLFSILADVRNEEGNYIPISLPKGIPNDISEYVMSQYSEFDYSHSFFSIRELLDADINFIVLDFLEYILSQIREFENYRDMRIIISFNG